jgi:hypothetical protein
MNPGNAVRPRNLPPLSLADRSRLPQEMIEQGRAVVLPNSVGAELVDPLEPIGSRRVDSKLLMASEFRNRQQNSMRP